MKCFNLLKPTLVNKTSFSACSSSERGCASSIFFCSSFCILAASAPNSGFFGTYLFIICLILNFIEIEIFLNVMEVYFTLYPTVCL